MRTVFATHELLPKGLDLESLSIETGRVSIRLSSGVKRCICPVCGRGSSRVHSRYSRTVSDLPWHGVSVALEVHARRFFCDEALCERRIFCERLTDVAARARKTDRLEGALLAIVLELGGRAAPAPGWPRSSASWSVGTPCSEGRRAPRCRTAGR